ncbi:hypothetical protein [Paracoccus sp. PAR01]|nr:hypothetical protein [Paracoccus sp. PAR01]
MSDLNKTLTMVNAPKAWGDVLAERQRQPSSEGWTREHDVQQT